MSQSSLLQSVAFTGGNARPQYGASAPAGGENAKSGAACGPARQRARGTRFTVGIRLGTPLDEFDPSEMIPIAWKVTSIMWHVVAPSEEDARAMVQSVWGPDFNFCIEEEAGYDLSPGYIHGFMFSWQERFAQTFERWKTTGIAQYWMPEIERQTIRKYCELRFKDRQLDELTEEDLTPRWD